MIPVSAMSAAPTRVVTETRPRVVCAGAFVAMGLGYPHPARVIGSVRTRSGARGQRRDVEDLGDDLDGGDQVAGAREDVGGALEAGAGGEALLVERPLAARG